MPRKSYLNSEDQTRESTSTPTQTDRIAEQIARLKQRQLEMVEETSRELEELQRDLSYASEVEQLRAQVEQLTSERHQLAQILTAFRGNLERQVHTLDQQFKVLSLDATETLESLLAALDTPSTSAARSFSPPQTPTLERTSSSPKTQALFFEPLLSEPQSQEIQPVKAPISSPTKKSRRFSPQRLAIRTLSFALILTAGYSSYHFLSPSTTILETGTVAGASTVAPPSNEEVAMDTYTESYANLPFEQTVWESSPDQEFGLTLSYPKNTSNRVRTVGGNNLWFLRKNGYLMKVTRIDTTLSLDAWWEENQHNYLDNGIAEKQQFKGRPTWIVTTTSTAPSAGNSYFVQNNQTILHIWTKNELPTTDDGRRIAHMLDTLIFTNK